MKYMKIVMVLTGILFSAVIAGCGNSAVVVDKEGTTSAIRAAEEVGASGISNASLYLQLAKEELLKAEAFAEKGDKEQAESMLMRAQADGELAVALSRSDNDKKEAIKAIERVDQLRQDNILLKERN
jgi:hypothetical protein